MYFVSEGIFFLRAGWRAFSTVIVNQAIIAPISPDDRMIGIILICLF